PSTNKVIGHAEEINSADYEKVIQTAQGAFKNWRTVPAPQRGEIVRQYGLALRKYKLELGTLVSIECGKILQEGLGEVQEMIDICDFAVGLSRQLHGFTMHSERPQHRMYDQYHPLGLAGIISAFNFPVAVWAWNAMIAAVCGDVTIWKPSEKVPLTAIACFKILEEIIRENDIPEGVFSLIIGGAAIGKMMSEDSRIPLISATGSIRMGKKVGAAVGARLGKSILELGGNNAIIISPDSDIEMAVRAAVFGAVGTCGQRCTSTRRLIIHEDIYDQVTDRLINIYKTLTIGNPLEEKNLAGPLIDHDAVKNYLSAIKEIEDEGGEILYGGETLTGGEYDEGNYVLPTLAAVQNDFAIVQEETFAPILYLIKYSGGIENAIHIQNDVKQGLSSAIFTNNMRESELFLSHVGSDCGIANVNIGTSGAEIGGAFG
ncbi:MAG: aldehyde dehydrogenase family protein, partial [Cyclobacteriaceae bacterium]|nr:aldehyde dehydrogenase family protein [Cyclobacteriaceae bacterium]